MGRDKRRFAFNTHLIIYAVMIFFFVLCSYFFFAEREFIGGVFFGLLACLGLFVVLISPMGVVFSTNELTIVYFFGVKETILRGKIRSIDERGSWGRGGGKFPYYSISYPHEKSKVFFVNGEIPKTRRTKKMLRMFWHEKIGGEIKCGKKEK